MKFRSLPVLAALLIAAVPLLPGIGEAAVGGSSSATPPKIDSRLAEVALTSGGGAVGEARRQGLAVSGALVVVEVFDEADTASTAMVIGKLGGTVLGQEKSRHLVAIAPDRLLDLAGDPSVAFVGVPAQPVTDGVVNEAVVGEGLAAWQEAGFDGSGIKVLVVDGGFSGLSQAQRDGELPALAGSQVGPTCQGGSIEESDRHGAAVAEVVHDMAPGAELYLYRTCWLYDGPDIARFVKRNKIDIVTQSLAYFNTVPLDGRDPWELYTFIDDIVKGGTLWFSSAGNYRQRHWRGMWSGEELLDFGGGTTSISMRFRADDPVFLRWDDWRLDLGADCSRCATDLDLDLHLLDQLGSVVASSHIGQSPTNPGPPIEAVVAPYDGTFRIQVTAEPGQAIPPGLALDLFTPSTNLPSSLQVNAGSLGDVATLSSVIAVGAVCWADSKIRFYSSEGPTTAGTLKPDIAAFDGISTSTYGASRSCDDGFRGTSASSPNAAGAAAVMMQASGARGREAWTLLAGLALDAGPSGPDTRYGVGVLNLGSPRSARCAGMPATIIALPGQQEVQGTAGPDVIVGSSRGSEIRAAAGDDVVCGLGGDDLVLGGGGADVIRGGGGDDDLRGGAGPDVILGGGGDDEIAGGNGDDTLSGGSGVNSLDGGGGSDRCRSGVHVAHCET